MTTPTSPAPSLDLALQQAIAHHQAGRLHEAEPLYRAILQARPDHPDANHNLGVLAGQAGQPAAGLIYLKTALALNPSQRHYALSYANALLAAGQAAEALAVLQSAVLRGLDSAEMQNNLGNALRALGQGREAAQSFHRALHIKPEYADAHYNLGCALQDLGLLEDAAASYRQALALQPGFVEAHNNLGVALRDLQQPEAAAASFRRALEVDAGYADAHYNLGNALRDQGRLDDAAASYRNALALRPDVADIHRNLGMTLRDLGQLENAALSFRRMLEIEPDNADARNDLGNVLRDLGRFGEAAANFRLVLQSQPDCAEVHSNLGNVLRELGQFDDAAASCRAALRIKPDFAGAHNNLGNALQHLGQPHEAMASYRRALHIKPDFAEAHNNLGNVLRILEQLDDAVASYRQALHIKPDFAEAHGNLGNALRHLGLFDEAAACFRLALKINPDLADAHNSLGIVLKNHSYAEAETHCRKALEINSDLVEAMVFLAELLAAKGQFSEAEGLLKRAMSINPDLPEAWSAIPGLRKMTQDDADWLAEAQRIVAQGLPARQEVYVQYALGKYFDDVKNYEQAFLHYRRANELTKVYGGKYDRQADTGTVDQLSRIYDREWVRRERKQASASALPVFIVGMPRSGTSLTEQILASHPAVFGAGELAFWQNASAVVAPLSLDHGISEAVLHQLEEDYLRLLTGLSSTALRVVDKMPGNFRCLGLIHAAFPKARIIHMQRNPIDTCLSIYFQHFDTYHTYANSLEDLAHYYTEYVRIMKHWHAALPSDSILHVPYESLVEDQEGWSRTMLEFIGLPWDARCKDFHQNMRTVGTVSHWQVRQKISKSSVARWRNYERFVDPLRSLLELEPDSRSS